MTLSSLKLHWYDYGARFYDPAVCRWLIQDPLAEEYYSITPYSYVANNPIMFIDPNGMYLWIPEVDDEGEVNYIAEEGDNAETLAKQYTITEDQALMIIGHGNDLETGTKISGEKVKSVTEESEILKLDMDEPETSTPGKSAEQAIFALDYCEKNNQSLNYYDFFSKADRFSRMWEHHNPNTNMTAEVNVNGKKLSIGFSITVNPDVNYSEYSYSPKSISSLNPKTNRFDIGYGVSGHNISRIWFGIPKEYLPEFNKINPVVFPMRQ